MKTNILNPRTFLSAVGIGIIVGSSLHLHEKHNEYLKKESSQILNKPAKISNVERHYEALKKYDLLECKEIDSLFSFMSHELRDPIKKVYLINQKDFFDGDVRAHVHPNNRIICMPEDWDEVCAFHETAHIKHRSLDDIGSGFSSKWKGIANFDYGKEIINLGGLAYLWKDKTIGPKDGLLEPYSGKTIDEDISNFVECAGYNRSPEEAEKFIFANPASGVRLMINIYPLYFCNTTDKRYQKKLDLLREYKFLTEKEHKTLSERLGSLYHLLDKEGEK